MKMQALALVMLVSAFVSEQARADPAPAPTAVLAAGQEQALNPMDVFKDCPDCPEMVVIPAGKFLMGRKDASERSNQGPQHEVTIARPFAVGRFSVTFDEWHKCFIAKACPFREGREEISRRPVLVTWLEAHDYTAWLSKLTGKPYRLLSEAEREYVTRAGTTTLYNTGDTITHEQAWYSTRTYYDAKESKPVGSFPPNAFGVYDTHGNMEEWVEDCWHDRYEGAPADGSAWIESGDCSSRVSRGGGWEEWANGITSATRGYAEVAPEALIGNGFRVARALDQ